MFEYRKLYIGGELKDSTDCTREPFICPANDEVIRMANETEAGLASYVFTENDRRIKRCSQELNFGEVQVNGFKYSIDLPHIGIKQSGIGCDCSYLALEDYMVKKRITVALNK